MVLDSGDSGSDADDDDDEADTDGRLLGAPGADDVPSRSLSPFSKPADDGSPASDVSPFSKPRARFASEGGTAQREDRMLRLGGADRASRRAHLAGLLRPVLQDAQTRLVFRAQALIVNDVGRFMPTEKDLNYPGVILKGAFPAGLLCSHRRRADHLVWALPPRRRSQPPKRASAGLPRPTSPPRPGTRPPTSRASSAPRTTTTRARCSGCRRSRSR